MNNNLTINKIPAIARIIPTETNKHFKLANIEQLSGISPTITSAIQHGEISDSQNSFGVIFPNKEETFFYIAECFDIKTHNATISEVGIGYYDNGIIFRDTVLAFKVDGKVSEPNQSGLDFSTYLSSSYGFIRTYTPSTLQELLMKPHSVIVSDDDPGPNIISFQPFSIMARLSNNITNVKLENLLDIIPNLASKITSFTHSLTFKCSKLFSSVLSCNNLELKATERSDFEGNLHFNVQTKQLEFFDGKQWLKVQTTKADNI